MARSLRWQLRRPAPLTAATFPSIRYVNAPRALAVDGFGNLYVANYYGNTVTVYAPYHTAVLRTISAGVNNPEALSFGP
jgi:hypothetical protein